MKIAVVSDTHSHTEMIQSVLHLIEPYHVEFILHCGDIEDADAVLLFPSKIHFVLGNCDMDRTDIIAAVNEIGAALHEPFGHLELDDKAIAFLHGHDKRLLRDLEQTNTFDFIFHGHTHQAEDRRSGRTRVINPGALFRARSKTFVIVDLKSEKVESVKVE